MQTPMIKEPPSKDILRPIRQWTDALLRKDAEWSVNKDILGEKTLEEQE